MCRSSIICFFCTENECKKLKFCQSVQVKVVIIVSANCKNYCPKTNTSFFFFRSYYFTEEELASLFTEAGFEILMNTYVQRRTVNFKKGIDVPRIFVQGKYRKPAQDGEKCFNLLYREDYVLF